MGKMPNLPVFKIKREDGRPGTKTIHRDHLLPIGQLVRLPTARQVEDPPAKPRTRADTRPRDLSPETQELEEFSDSSSDWGYYVPLRDSTSWREFAQRRTNAARPVVDVEDDLPFTPEVEDRNSSSDHDPEREPDHDPEREPDHEPEAEPDD